MEIPQISRSGRVLKKSAKVKEMEDFDINELDAQGTSRKKAKTMDDSDEFDDKRVAPIKIPKISFNVQPGKKKINEMPSLGKQAYKQSLQSPVKGNQNVNRAMYQDSSDASKESDSSSVSSESSSSSPTSSDVSDNDDRYNSEYRNDRKVIASNMQSLSVHQDKEIVDQQQQRFESPAYMGPSSDMSSDDSEDAGSDSALVIAEDSDQSANYPRKGQRGGAKKGGVKKNPAFASRQGGNRRKAPSKATGNAATRRKKPVPAGAGMSKPLTAYMLWSSENRKRIAASGNIGLGNIGKKLGETWQSMSEKEKMAWRRKAKQLALKNSGNVSRTGSSIAVQNKPSTSRAALAINEDLFKGLPDSPCALGTGPIDVAAHLKLLGDSLTVIGQRLIEHEGQLAVSGIFSVLLDTLLCAIGPLLCLTTEVAGLENLPKDTFKKTLDHIAYFMPGL